MKHSEIFTRLAQRADPNIPILEAAMDEIAALEAESGQLRDANFDFNRSLTARNNEYREANAAIAQLEAENYDWLQEVDKLLKTIRYLVGIAERGLGVKWADHSERTAEQFVLGYVKSLEAELAAADCALQESGDRANTIAQQAEENTRLLQANRDCIDHFEALKEDFDKQAERIKKLDSSVDFYKRRADLFQEWQSKMRDPERTIVCDILANGHTLPPECAGDRYKVVDTSIDLAAAEKDAERYRWLRTSDQEVCAVRVIGYSDEYHWHEIAGEGLDAAIDAAIAEGK